MNLDDLRAAARRAQRQVDLVQTMVDPAIAAVGPHLRAAAATVAAVASGGRPPTPGADPQPVPGVGPAPAATARGSDGREAGASSAGDGGAERAAGPAAGPSPRAGADRPPGPAPRLDPVELSALRHLVARLEAGSEFVPDADLYDLLNDAGVPDPVGAVTRVRDVLCHVGAAEPWEHRYASSGHTEGPPHALGPWPPPGADAARCDRGLGLRVTGGAVLILRRLDAPTNRPEPVAAPDPSLAALSPAEVAAVLTPVERSAVQALAARRTAGETFVEVAGGRDLVEVVVPGTPWAGGAEATRGLEGYGLVTAWERRLSPVGFLADVEGPRGSLGNHEWPVRYGWRLLPRLALVALHFREFPPVPPADVVLDPGTLAAARGMLANLDVLAANTTVRGWAVDWAAGLTGQSPATPAEQTGIGVDPPAAETDRPAASAPGWAELGDAKRAILTALGQYAERRDGKAIAAKAGYTYGSIRHHFGDLQRWNYVDRDSDGYALTPAGAALVPRESV
ncbi:MAG: hypothetical protein C0501_07935 [Isosphaera sp.]|nr:hypothetical protein [Isosphaera sp.]